MSGCELPTTTSESRNLSTGVVVTTLKKKKGVNSTDETGMISEVIPFL